MQDRYEKQEIRCPKLGHEVTFGYCRQEGGATPCQRIISCWGGRLRMDIQAQQNFGSELWRRLDSLKMKDRLSTLLELVQKIRGGGRKGDDGSV